MSDPMVLAQTDPTGFGTPFGQIVSVLVLLAALVVLVRWWVRQRKR